MTVGKIHMDSFDDWCLLPLADIPYSYKKTTFQLTNIDYKNYHTVQKLS